MTMNTRRQLLKYGLLTAGAAGASALLPRGLAAAPRLLAPRTTAPKRFIFMHKGNGLLPSAMVPPSFGDDLKQREKRREAYGVDLAGHELPSWLAPLAGHVDDLTILQGLSGKMCTTGHHSWCSALGAFKANERLSSIRWATVDFELAKLFPSPLEHIELACFPTGGGNARGNINGIETGFSARGAQQPNYAFGSARVAIDELFKSVSDDQRQKDLYRLDREVLAFTARHHGEIAEDLRGIEASKVGNYAESIEAIRRRDAKIEAMADTIRENLPKLPEAWLKDDISTLDRQHGHVEVLLSTLIAGMTNVVAFTVDELATPYTGLPGIENETVNLHDVGHGKSFGGVEALQIRELVRHQHSKLIARIVERLKAEPEGSGTMFDNTMLFYFPDNGETHHSHGTEYPFVVMAGKNAGVDLRRRYIRLPDYGKRGHKTLGNWWTTILNAHGNPIEHFGALDSGLAQFGIDQRGPIASFPA